MRSAAIWLLVTYIAAVPAHAQCLSYEPTAVALEGLLSTKIFYGPPNYGETPQQDAKEPQYLLSLEKPICTNRDPKSPDLNEAESSVTVVELVAGTAELRKALRSALGRKVLVNGTLFHAQTAHHHTPVVLTLTQVRDAV
jgi:hypothetical protein